MSLHLVVAHRHHATASQYDVITVVELVGPVFSPLKDHTVHRSYRAVISSALDLYSIASPQIALHWANVDRGHTARQASGVTALGARELEPGSGPFFPQSLSGPADRPRPIPKTPPAPR